MSRDTAISDVILAPTAVVVGNSLLGLFLTIPFLRPARSTPVLIGATLLVVLAVGILFPRWLARERDEESVTQSSRDGSQVVQAALVALPLVLGGVTLRMAAGSGVADADTWLGDLTRFTGNWIEASLLVVALVGAAGVFLIVVLVARRAPDAFRGPELATSGALRTFGMGLAGAAVVLNLLLSVAGQRPWSTGPVVGLALVAMVVMVDRLVPKGATINRTAALTPAIAVAVVWVLGSGLLSGSLNLLGALTTAAAGGAIALAMGLLVSVRRTWVGLLLPFAASLWLGVQVLPLG